MKLTRVLFAAVFLTAAAFGATAQAQMAGPAPPPGVPGAASPTLAPAATPAKSDADAEYILGPEDVIEIEVVGQADHVRSRIYTDGTINVNLIGTTKIAGMTPRQAADHLAGLLKAGGFYANPRINVEVVSYASRYVTVLGSVGAPGLVPMNRPFRLSEILARVGGVHPGAADYLIVTSEDGKESRYLIKDVASGQGDKDPFVKAGDKIYSPVADVFYISGQVRNPGPYPITQGMTLTEAIAKAGGLSESGSDKGAKLTRAGKKGKLNPNDKVLADDVIVVNERLF